MNQLSLLPLLEGIRYRAEELLGTTVEIRESFGDPEAPSLDLNGWSVVAHYTVPRFPRLCHVLPLRRYEKMTLFSVNRMIPWVGTRDSSITCWVATGAAASMVVEQVRSFAKANNIGKVSYQ